MAGSTTQLVNTNMTNFFIKKLPYDLSSHAGLAFVGKYLKRVNVNPLIDPMSERTGVGLQPSIRVRTLDLYVTPPARGGVDTPKLCSEKR